MDDYNSAILHGIVKIASKMGISTIQSYQGSKIFEAIGIDSKVMDEYFTGYGQPGGRHYAGGYRRSRRMSFTPQPLIPLGLNVDLTLDSVGRHKMQKRRREAPVQSPDHPSACRSPRSAAIIRCSRNTRSLINGETNRGYLRRLLDFNYPKKGVPIEEVESVESIVTAV